MAITRNIVRQFFLDNAARGIDLHRDMLWGYFFIDPKRRALKAAIPVLAKAGYRHVDILEPAADGNANFYLHVERVERHSAASLYRRCTALAALAKQLGILAYDGFDVGNVDGTNLTNH